MTSDECHIDNCTKTEVSHGLCSTHLARYYRWGDPYYYAYGHDGYTAVHNRVRKQRGQPRDHECAGCNIKRADEWAYDHRDPNEKRGTSGMLFSDDETHYIPLCRRCHKKFDALVRRMKESVLA